MADFLALDAHAEPPAPAHKPVRWEAPRGAPQAAWQGLSLPVMLVRGLRDRCPVCGARGLFAGYLKVRPACTACTAPLGLARAEDAPPYFTVFAVGHLIVPPMLLAERAWQPSVWLSGLVWSSAALALTLLLLRPIKGATVGLMLKLGLLKSDAEA